MKIKQSNPFGALRPEDLAAFETRHALQLPEDYRRFLLAHNGGVPIPNTIDFVAQGAPTSSDVSAFYGLHAGEAWASLAWHMDIFEGRIPPDGLPIAGDSGGNQYVLIVRGARRGQVFFWDHEGETDPPGEENMSLVAASFTAFTGKLYEYVPPDESEVQRIVRQNDLDGLKRLLAGGYDVETVDAYNRTLIENAAIHNRAAMIQLLFDRGAALRNALQLARQNYKFFPEHKPSVELLERLTDLKR